MSEARRPLPELLAPAGDWECVKAAIENGADAIYFGLDRFNARMRAANFTEADLPRLMEFLHRRGLKGYLTVNTLVFTDELPEAERFLRLCIVAGVDAAIVQDVGICRLIRRLSPDFPIHASTQMTITSAAGVAFARELGCQLVVLARECSLKDIERIQSAQHHPASQPPTINSPLPLEVFIHGALCVAYSGQCLTSESLGGRSANRGECAQACRLPYELVADGRPVPLGNRRYLLSPQDLAGLDLLPELVRAGVASLKIEGRLKSPEYVASITRIYRQALDQGAGPTTTGDSPTDPPRRNNPESTVGDPQYEMQMAFSRGLSPGWFRGTNNQALVHGRFGKKRGVFLGEISRVAGERVRLRLAGPLKPGDGVVFDAGRPDEDEQGGRVYEVRHLPAARSGLAEAELAFGRGDVDFSRVQVGDKLWKTSDPELERRLRQSFAGEAPRFARPIEMALRGAAGTPLTLVARDEPGNAAQVESTMPLAAAMNRPFTTERLREQLGRLGGTPFRLGRLDNQLEGAVILPISELNRLRREVVAALAERRTRPRRWTLNEPAPPLPCRNASPGLTEPELIVLVRDLAQLDAALQCDVRTIYCELEDPKKYREAVARFRAVVAANPQLSTSKPQPSIWVAPPRIIKPGEEWILKQVRSCDADGYLVRNFDHLAFFAQDRRVGDYSLNIANPLTADYFRERFGLERLTVSYDLNNAQLEALLRSAPPAWFEITIHQHMPMFHMEHCLACAFLSSGTDYTNCGRPCDRHDVRLRDRVGAEHPVKADAGCRNTVFNALAQTGAEYVARLLVLGGRHFRVEFLTETSAEVTRTIGHYRQLLRGEITGADLWRELRLCHQLGVTRGSLDRGERPVTVLGR